MPPAEATSAAEDAYAPRCLHGTLPLVRDEGEASGYRFARIGQDSPDACISDPADLPAGELSLRTFHSASEAEAYAAALAEHGGNAFTTLVSPVVSGVESVLLVIRHDREREAAATLDEAVRLIGPGAPSPAAWSRARVSGVAAAEDGRRREAVRKRWQSAEDAIRSAGDIYVTGRSEAGVEFMANASRVRFLLAGEPSAPVVTWKPIAHRLDDDLMPIFASAVAAAGVKSTAGGHRIELASLAAAELVRAVEAERAIAIAEERLSDVSGTRRRLAEIAADPAAARVLARATAGLPVLSVEPGAPAAQLSPRSGTPQSVPGSLLGRLLAHGLLTAAWLPGNTTRADPETWCPGLYVATEAAHLVAEGRMADAAALVGNTRMPRPAYPPIHKGGLFQALAELAHLLRPEDRDRMIPALGEQLPQDGETLAAAAGYGRNYSSWSPIVHGALAGLIDIDVAGHIRRLPSTEPVASPCC